MGALEEDRHIKLSVRVFNARNLHGKTMKYRVDDKGIPVLSIDDLEVCTGRTECAWRAGAMAAAAGISW